MLAAPQFSPLDSLSDGLLDVCHIEKAALKAVMELIASNLSGENAPEDEVSP